MPEAERRAVLFAGFVPLGIRLRDPVCFPVSHGQPESGT